MTTERLSLMMNTFKLAKSASAPEGASARAGRLAVWILLAIGLLLMLVGVAKAEQPSANRVDRFRGPMTPGQSVQIENISGDIVAAPGKEFAAVVTVTVFAPTQKRAEEILEKTKVAGNRDDDGWSLETRWPGMRNSRGREGRHGSGCPNCRIVVRYDIVVPPGVTAELKTVNGDVRVKDCDGDLELESVNGSIEARGVRKAVQAQTVNGKIDAAASALLPGTAVELQSVNGSVTLTLPKDAKFDLTASTMNGTIASTFPLPPRIPETPLEEPIRKEPKTPKPSKAPNPPKADHGKRVVVQDGEGETTIVDLRELEQELSESMKEVGAQIEEGMRDAEKGMREVEKELRRIRIDDPRQDYAGSIGRGGAQIRLETLNGTVLLLAAGTKEADAKPLISGRRSFVVTIPRVEVRVPHPRVVIRMPPTAPTAPVAPAPPAPPVARVPGAPLIMPAPAPPVFDGEVVRGEVSGDFLSTSSGGNYRVGNVSGRVRILTHSGEIRVGSVGAGADLKSFGGDIVVGAITGDLKAITMAGDIRADGVSGSALLDTAGGDLRIERVGGSLDAKTAGGDIIAPHVGGSVHAVTAGGDIRIGVTSREIKGGVTIHNSGGDVSLVLPADCKADVELIVTGADESESAIRSDFANLAISKNSGHQRATLSLNGGGEKVVVRTSSGTIRLKKN
jgi:DUF4097 and DUF4098 domain-containing protein YvlB